MYSIIIGTMVSFMMDTFMFINGENSVSTEPNIYIAWAEWSMAIIGLVLVVKNFKEDVFNGADKNNL